MSGRGSTSATARIAAIVENNREAFGRIAGRAERNANAGFSRTLAETARAAESLVGTERAAALLADSALKSIRKEVEGAHGEVTVSALSDIKKRNAKRLIFDNSQNAAMDDFILADFILMSRRFKKRPIWPTPPLRTRRRTPPQRRRRRTPPWRVL